MSTATPDTSHLTAIHERLYRERRRLSEATSKQERALRTVWVAQIEKELADELAHLGLSAEVGEIGDDELLAELSACCATCSHFAQHDGETETRCWFHVPCTPEHWCLEFSAKTEA